MDVEKAGLLSLLAAQLERQGFVVKDGVVVGGPADKSHAREVHAVATQEARDRARPALERFESKFLESLGATRPIPTEVDPEIVLVPHGDSFEARLWRWISLHWSIPVSGGYGRRMRFLVRDRANGGALIGIIGLTDPVFSLKARDEWIGWTHADRRSALVHVMEAFALGAAPPYDSMLGGKLVAMLATSREVLKGFEAKYQGSTSRILERADAGSLYAITTQSAFGRSSLYNRISAPDGERLWEHVGFTRGTGDFHLGGELYEKLFVLAKSTLGPGERGAVSSAWKANGFRNRRDVLDVALRELGLDARVLRNHGVRRGVYVAPLVANLGASLRGETEPIPRTFTSADLTATWAERWGENASRRSPSTAANWRLYDRTTAAS